MAITTATIQHRRGNLDDFNPDKMVPGELAFTTDGSRKVFAAFAPGDYKELASTEKVQGIVDAFKQTAQDIVDDALQDIEEKADESLARIPEFADKANVIVTEKSGDVVTASDSSSDPFAGLNLYGKSTQETTTGAQLAKITDGTQTINGITVKRENGKITVSGTPTTVDSRYSQFYVGSVEVIKASTYYTTSLNEKITGVGVTLGSSGSFNLTMAESNKTKTGMISTESTTNNVVVNVSHGVGTINKTFEIMFNESSTALPFEPYTGGIAAPNPDYPMTIESSGDSGSIEVGVYGKNLLENAVTTTHNGITFAVNDDGSVTLNGTATAYAFVQFEISLPIGSYILSGSVVNMGIYIRTADANIAGSSNGVESKFKVTDSTQLYCRFAAGEGESFTNEVIYPMIRLASITDATYEPYTAQTLTVSTPNGLCGIPVTDASIANYTDDNGQMWVCDEVDFEKGVYVQRVGTCTFDGETNKFTGKSGVTHIDIFSDDGTCTPDSFVITDIKSIVPVLCSHLVAVSWEGQYTSGYEGVCYSNSKPALRIGFDTALGLSSLDLANTWLAEQYAAGTPLTVTYILATPIQTALTAEQIEAYKALHSNYPNTTIMNDSGAGMGVKFRADTQKHIEQNYVPVSEFQALVNRISTLETLALS